MRIDRHKAQREAIRIARARGETRVTLRCADCDAVEVTISISRAAKIVGIGAGFVCSQCDRPGRFAR